MTLDITLSPIYRINGQEISNLPGLSALTPPQNAAHGREKDRLIAYLLLTGNSTFSTSEYLQVAKDAANIFYQTSGSLTSALRTAADHVNTALLERNMTTSKNGQFAIGWLTLAAVRDSQCTLALSGPMHVYWFGQNEIRHIHEPAASGKGLGANQTTNVHYSQTTLSAGDRLLFFGRAPGPWDIALNDPSPASLDATRRRLITLTHDDLNAVLIQAADGAGGLNLLSGTSESKVETAPPPATPQLAHPQQAREASTPEVSPASQPAAHVVQPSAYAIPPQHEEPPRTNLLDSLPRTQNAAPRDFPASIPRIQPAPVDSGTTPPTVEVEERLTAEKNIQPAQPAQPEAPREPSARTRQTAKALATGIQSTRRISEIISERLKNFLPRLLPNSETNETIAPSNAAMIFMAILIPLMVVTIASVVYLRYGRSQQYETYLRQAQEMQAQALTLTNPVEERQAWENVLLSVDIAESHRKTSDTATIRQTAESNLDKLLGITRMQFNPAFSSNLGIEISRMAANETDLYVLNAATGEAIHAQATTNGRGFQIDTTFSCKPGVYGKYTVGALVDILTLPALNSINATLLGIDAGGNLLYCAPGQVAQAIPLPPPDTNWGRVTAFTLDGGNLYVLDSSARAVWVYNGKDGTFLDRPYFFFGGQTPEKQDVIDLVISGDDLYLLHADGHLSTCSYSRIESKPTRCQDPTPLVNPFAAYQGADLFASAHFTQMLFTALPNQSILLLDADTQGVLRFAPRTLELQSQFRPTTGSANPIPAGTVGAIAVGPNHILYLAVNGQVYFATDMP
jgi:hypothetical protein